MGNPVGRPRKKQPVQLQEVQLQEAVAEPEKQDGFISPTATPELNPRAQILADISARSNAQADEDAKEIIPGMEGEETSPVIEMEAEESEEKAEPVVETHATESTISEPQFNPDLEYELTVNGQPIKVKGSQIIERGKSAIQKEIAADYKLEAATKLFEEAKKLATPPVVETPKLSAEQLAEVIQFGTKEQAAAAITMIMGNQEQGKQLQDMASKLPQVVSDQIAFHDATVFVQSEYKDLLEDPDLRSLFFMKENGMRQAGDSRPYKELYKAIGDELRVKFNRPKSTTTKTMEEKVAAKEATPSVPRLASARLESAPEKKPPTTQEVIDRMRKARGQQPHSQTIN